MPPCQQDVPAATDKPWPVGTGPRRCAGCRNSHRSYSVTAGIGAAGSRTTNPPSESHTKATGKFSWLAAQRSLTLPSSLDPRTLQGWANLTQARGAVLAEHPLPSRAASRSGSAIPKGDRTGLRSHRASARAEQTSRALPAVSYGTVTPDVLRLRCTACPPRQARGAIRHDAGCGSI